MEQMSKLITEIEDILPLTLVGGDIHLELDNFGDIDRS